MRIVYLVISTDQWASDRSGRRYEHAPENLHRCFSTEVWYCVGAVAIAFMMTVMMEWSRARFLPHRLYSSQLDSQHAYTRLYNRGTYILRKHGRFHYHDHLALYGRTYIHRASRESSARRNIRGLVESG
jgi:hypothetical protein